MKHESFLCYFEKIKEKNEKKLNIKNGGNLGFCKKS